MSVRKVKRLDRNNVIEKASGVSRLELETRQTLRGRVKDWDGKPAANAVVRLYEVKQKGESEYLRQAFTDKTGEFDLGLVRRDKDYILDVWYEDAKAKKVLIAKEKSGFDYHEDYGEETDEEGEE